jgi:glutaredoxin
MTAATSDDLFNVEVLTVYGADWCPDCRRTKRWLEASGAEYRYVDRDADKDLKRRLADAGYLAIPVVVFPGGTILVEPSDADMAAALSAAALS